MGNFPESLSQAVLVGIILVGRLGVLSQRLPRAGLLKGFNHESEGALRANELCANPREPCVNELCSGAYQKETRPRSLEQERLTEIRRTVGVHTVSFQDYNLERLAQPLGTSNFESATCIKIAIVLGFEPSF